MKHFRMKCLLYTKNIKWVRQNISRYSLNLSHNEVFMPCAKDFESHKEHMLCAACWCLRSEGSLWVPCWVPFRSLYYIFLSVAYDDTFWWMYLMLINGLFRVRMRKVTITPVTQQDLTHRRKQQHYQVCMCTYQLWV